MSRNAWLAPLLALAVAGGLAACTKDPVRPVNHDPTITSLTAWPTALAPGDSTLVVCTATDRDGDALVCDWFTDSRLVIKGDPLNEHELYNTSSNSHVFYHGAVTPYDSAWVRCIVRDGKGGAHGGIVRVLVNQ